MQKTSLSFLDLCLSIPDDKISTSIDYKPTDTHGYLQYGSSQPPHCKNAIPYNQFLRLRRICSDETDFEEKSAEMGIFFARRGYPQRIITSSQRKAKDTSCDTALRTPRRETSGHSGRLRLVLTYHPKNQEVKN